MENYQLDATMEAIQTTTIEKTQASGVIYTAKTHTTGGREGRSTSSDGNLEIRLATPGTSQTGTNPEQLFAAGWSACFTGAMKIAAGKMKVRFPQDGSVDAEVDLCNVDGGYHLQARLNVSLPGLDRNTAEALVQSASETCPYSKAVHGNINVEYNVV